MVRFGSKVIHRETGREKERERERKKKRARRSVERKPKATKQLEARSTSEDKQ
jgi:hypothetical protein